MSGCFKHVPGYLSYFCNYNLPRGKGYPKGMMSVYSSDNDTPCVMYLTEEIVFYISFEYQLIQVIVM